MTPHLRCDGTPNGFKSTRQAVDALFLVLETSDKELSLYALLEVCPDGSHFSQQVITPARSVLEGSMSRRAKDDPGAYDGKKQNARVRGHVNCLSGYRHDSSRFSSPGLTRRARRILQTNPAMKPTNVTSKVEPQPTNADPTPPSVVSQL